MAERSPNDQRAGASLVADALARRRAVREAKAIASMKRAFRA
jgi:hypothetical protein